MAKILSASCGQCVSRMERLEMTVAVKLLGGIQQSYSFNVSHKKHVISSYKTNWTPPPSADVNTLVNMSEGEFKSAFSEYGRLLVSKLQSQESSDFHPSAPMNRILTHGIAFSSDVKNLGGNVHCFPFNISPAQTPKCISLSKETFDNFKIVANFLYRASGVQPASAKKSWDAISLLIRGRVGQPNELFSSVEIRTLEIRLQQGGTLQQLLRSEDSAIRKAQNVGSRLVSDPNRRPFRSGG